MLLIALASAAAIILAARGALDTHRATIDVMHGIGATDQQLAGCSSGRSPSTRFRAEWPVPRPPGWSSPSSSAGPATPRLLSGSPPLDWNDALLLLLLPIAIALLATLGCKGRADEGIARTLMIARLLAFLIVLYALGFALFAVTLGTPAAADTPNVDAIVVITGGKGRIEHAASLLADGKAKRMLIAGADPVGEKD